MSPEGTVRATRLWKRFRAERRRMLLRDEVARLAARMRGDQAYGWRWALRDVDLHAEPGDSVGLIGSNGSGKSTLLKILTSVMYPHSGRLEVSGRVGALIEIRAGLHGDLSGRENVSLYGSLLGLPRREVAARFDEIVSFAELEGAIDRQLKFYSSGMQMRLGFAVAAFLDPDVLLVDEVLAVGDASFQQRCLDRIRDVIARGTTVIFVSHDLAAVEATCAKGLWLEQGVVRHAGPIREVARAYRRAIEEGAEAAPRVNGVVSILKIQVSDGGEVARTGGPLEVRLTLRSEDNVWGRLLLGVSEGPATPIALVGRDLELRAGDTEVGCRIGYLPLPRGRYYLWAGIFAANRDLLAWHPAANFDVAGPELDETPVGIVRLAPIQLDSRWEVE